MVLLSISHWFPLGINPLELLGAFAHFTLLLSIAVVAISAVFRSRILGLSALTASVISGALVIPHFLPTDYSGDAVLTVGHFNLYHNNPTSALAINSIVESAPDIFTIQELNEEWSTITDSVFSSSHPYMVEAPMESCCYGIGLYSKFPLVSYKVLEIERTPVITAQVLVQERIITVVSLHTLPPAFPNETQERDLQLQTVASIAATGETDCLVIGDFNVVPWDDAFSFFLKSGKLHAARNGFQATFPTDFGIPLIPIDHITYSDNLIPVSSDVVTIIGSDHRGLVAGFAFAD